MRYGRSKMFGKNEGPTAVPGHTTYTMPRNTCAGCRYFSSRTEGNVCGGFGARVGPTVTRCEHPEAMHYYDATGFRGEAEDQLVLPTSDRGTPRVISRSEAGFGYHDTTPSWCPYLLKEKKT